MSAKPGQKTDYSQYYVKRLFPSNKYGTLNTKLLRDVYYGKQSF